MALTLEEIEAAISGDRASVEKLTKALLPRIFGLCFRFTRDRSLAEDATQESFVNILRNLAAVKDPEKLVSWALTIAANTTRSMLRIESKTQPLELPDRIMAADDSLGSESSKHARALDIAITRLPEGERELLLLHSIQGIKLKDLASQSGIGYSAIKVKIHRIRAKLRIEAASVLQELEGVEQ